MIKASYQKYTLNFKQASGTSRGVLKTKDTWFIILVLGTQKGIGECAMFKGLSCDDVPNYETKLHWVCQNIHLGLTTLVSELSQFPSIIFGLETAFKSLYAQEPFEIFSSNFYKGLDKISINGLVWMGPKAFMKAQIIKIIDSGFKCIKLKIGALDFETEIELIQFIRKTFSINDIEIRVDANGAFTPQDAFNKLEILAQLNLHSIEQPIAQGQTEAMATLCEKTPLPIALDEELIGANNTPNKMQLLKAIKPQYIILKPSLVGGFTGCDDWIRIANSLNINWWITSALESNIGLNAIAQYTYTKQNSLAQGLGTGTLFSNNFNSPLEVKNGFLVYNNLLPWCFNI